MDKNLVISPAPHIFSTNTTQKVMLNVIIALLPTLVASGIIFGFQAIFLTLVTVASCVGFEHLYTCIMKKPSSVDDLSAVVTGILLAFNLPSTLPWYMAIIGAFVAIVIVKMIFGGLGYNFANPAIVSRLVLTVSFTSAMTAWTFPENGISALATATPLGADLFGGSQTMLTLFLGNHGGVLGETCAVTLILGGLYLIFTKTISAIIPASYIGTVAVLSVLAGENALMQVLSGGLLLGAFFMATDYVTSPFTRKGKLVFGICLGIITCGIRFFANSAEGVAFSILIMNLFVPYINDLTRQKVLGCKKPKKVKKAKAVKETVVEEITEQTEPVEKVNFLKANFDTVVKPIIVMVCICVVISLALGATNLVTTPIIEETNRKIANEGRFALIPEAEDFTEVTSDVENIVDIYTSTNEVGTVITSIGKGYGGPITVMVALDNDGKVVAVNVMSHTETPGKGEVIEEPSFTDQFIGNDNDTFNASEIDAVAGSTVSSKAVISAVDTAISAYATEVAK